MGVLKTTKILVLKIIRLYMVAIQCLHNICMSSDLQLFDCKDMYVHMYLSLRLTYSCDEILWQDFHIIGLITGEIFQLIAIVIT